MFYWCLVWFENSTCPYNSCCRTTKASARANLQATRTQTNANRNEYVIGVCSDYTRVIFDYIILLFTLQHIYSIHYSIYTNPMISLELFQTNIRWNAKIWRMGMASHKIWEASKRVGVLRVGGSPQHRILILRHTRKIPQVSEIFSPSKSNSEFAHENRRFHKAPKGKDHLPTITLQVQGWFESSLSIASAWSETYNNMNVNGHRHSYQYMRVAPSTFQVMYCMSSDILLLDLCIRIDGWPNPAETHFF